MNYFNGGKILKQLQFWLYFSTCRTQASRSPRVVWGDQCLVNLEEIWPLGLERWWRARKVTMIGNTKKCSSVSGFDATAALHLFPCRSIWKSVPWHFSHFRTWDFHPHSKLDLKSSVLLGTRSEGKNTLWANGRTFPFLEHQRERLMSASLDSRGGDDKKFSVRSQAYEPRKLSLCIRTAAPTTPK